MRAPKLSDVKVEPVIVAELVYDVDEDGRGCFCQVDRDFEDGGYGSGSGSGGKERVEEIIADYGEVAVGVFVPYVIRVVWRDEGDVFGYGRGGELKVGMCEGIWIEAVGRDFGDDGNKVVWMDLVFWMVPLVCGEVGKAKMSLKVREEECDVVVMVRGVEAKVDVMCERAGGFEVGAEEEDRVLEPVIGGQGVVSFMPGHNFGNCEVVVRNDMDSTAPLLIHARLTDDSGGAFTLVPPDSHLVYQQNDDEAIWNEGDALGSKRSTDSCYVLVGKGEEAAFVVGFEMQDREPRPDCYYGHLEVMLAGSVEFGQTDLSLAKLTHWMISLEAASGREATEEAWEKFASKRVFLTNHQNDGKVLLSGKDRSKPVFDDRSDAEGAHNENNADDKENQQSKEWTDQIITSKAFTPQKQVSRGASKHSPKRTRSARKGNQQASPENDLAEITSEPKKYARGVMTNQSNNLQPMQRPTEQAEENRNNADQAARPKLHLPRWLRRARVITLACNQDATYLKLRNATDTTLFYTTKIIRHAPGEDQKTPFNDDSNRCHDVSCTPGSGTIPPKGIFELTLQQRQDFEQSCMLMVECATASGSKVYGFPVHCPQENDRTILYD